MRLSRVGKLQGGLELINWTLPRNSPDLTLNFPARRRWLFVHGRKIISAEIVLPGPKLCQRPSLRLVGRQGSRRAPLRWSLRSPRAEPVSLLASEW